MFELRILLGDVTFVFQESIEKKKFYILAYFCVIQLSYS